jgi:hypothetical protein
MSRAIRSKQNFNAGEISPRLYSRSDVEKYANALKTMINALPISHGPAKRRNGTQFIAEVKDSTKEVRLVKFQFSADDSFILEFGENYIRFYTAKAQVQDGGTPVEVVTPWTASELDELQFSQFGDTMYIVHPNHAPRTLIRNSSLSWTLSNFAAFPPPTEELGHQDGAITITPSATSGFGINFTASSSLFLEGDIGRQIINTSDGETGRASIVSLTSGTVVVCDIVEEFTDLNAINGGDWRLDLSPVSDLTPDGTKVGSIVNITCDDPNSTSARDTFRSGDIGKYLLMHNGVAEVLQVNSASDIDVEVLKSFDSLDETGNWTIEEETWSSARGYPRAVGFYEQRLIFGGSAAEPQSLWFSETGIFDGFGVGDNDADAIDVDIVSSEVNQIEWISSGRDLVIGTSGAETTVTGAGGGITPSTIQLRPRTYYGSNTQNVVTAGSEIMFIQKSTRKIRTFIYNFDIDGYKAEDLVYLAEHLTEGSGGKIKEMSYAQEPESLLYVVLEGGDMLCGSFNREQSVVGWSKLATTGSFERVATISEDEEDQVWVVANRTVDGNTVRYIEVIDNGDGTETTHGFSDSYLTYSGAATDTLSGLDHLEGETVQVKANGAAHSDQVVSGGSISLDFEATSATVGLAYTTTIETLDEDFNVGRGSMLTQDVSWVEPVLRVYQSTAPLVDGQSKPRRDPSMEMDQAVDLFTGDLRYSRVDSPRLTITTSEPFPLILTGIFGIVEGDG